jgi:hypothetical protein
MPNTLKTCDALGSQLLAQSLYVWVLKKRHQLAGTTGTYAWFHLPLLNATRLQLGPLIAQSGISSGWQTNCL